MAINAYIGLKVNVKEAEKILEELKKEEYVVQADAVTGSFDIIALLRAPDFHSLGQFIIRKIGSIPGVLDTETFPIIEFGR
uniref:Lrp/AsnC family transcriptional regulator n=1 Tax=candidate division WOR-3 bacterium TaxID=2052148 RepID=A0A7C4YR86_UNCW3